jgi:hypothetical protein
VTEPTTEQRAAELIRHIGIVGIVGVALGLIVGGIGGRVVMRIAGIVAPDHAQGAMTENGNAIGDITVGGTIELIIFVGIFFGAVGAVAYVISERWLSWTGPFRPLAFGLLILVVGAPDVLDPENLDFLLVGNFELVVAMFVALFLLYGIPMPLLVSALEGRLPGVDPARPIDSVAVYLALAGFGALFAVLIAVFLIIELGENELAAAFLIFGMGLATALIWLADYLDVSGKLLPTLARLLGYCSLIGAMAVGTWQTWTGISDILAGDFF